MDNTNNLENLYKTQWRAYYKRGLGAPTIVYGETHDDAVRAALAEFRRINGVQGSVDMMTAAQVVDKVELIG